MAGPNGGRSNRGRSRSRGRGGRFGRGNGTYRPPVKTDNPTPATTDAPDDIGTVLQQLGNAIAMLSKRLDSMENRGPDKPSDRKKVSTRTVNAGPHTTTQSSNNADFASVSKCIYRLVQLQHHEKNWEVLPKSIDDRLQRLASDINPPMVDDEFRQRMKTAATKFGSEITDLVRDHLRRKLADKEIEAGRLDPTDIDRAKEVAAKYVGVRLGQRLDEGRRSQLLTEAAATIGAFRRPPPVPAATTTASTSATDHQWRVVGRQDRHAADDVVATTSRKRKPSTPDTTPVSNRFDALGNDTDSSQSDVEPANSSASGSPAHARRSPKKLRSTGHHMTTTTDSGVRVFHGPKESWTIEPSADTTTIVLGDSNLRRVPEIPDGWEVHSLSGAHFRHVAAAIRRLSGPPKKFNVVIQAGINHRDHVDDTTDREIDSLVEQAQAHPAINGVFHIGVSATPTMSPMEANNVKRINGRFEYNLSAVRCSPPIPVDEVRTTPGDAHGIHYTEETSGKIIDCIQATIIHCF